MSGDPLLTTLAADLFGVTINPEQAAQFDIFTRELIAWNTHTNLTGIIEPEAVRIRHHLDSLSIVSAVALRDGMTVIDVGTGAGFPGLPLAIVYPAIQVTLMEATGKKVAFMDHVIAELGLTNARTLHARAEEAGQMPDQRAAYDLVLARAVARLPALCEYLLPLARVGGRCIAMKGASAHEEAKDSRHALQILGGRMDRIVEVPLPDVDEPHYLVVIEKTDATPTPYPRKPGIPTRKPL